MKFIYGNEKYLNERELSKYINKDSEVIKHDSSSSIEAILEDVQTISFFDNDKVVVVTDHQLLSKKPVSEKFLKEITEGVSVELIFIVNSKRITKTNPTIKFLLKEADVVETKEVTKRNVRTFIRDIGNDLNISIENSAIELLVEKLPLNLGIISSELLKLSLEDQNITSNMVEVSIASYHGVDAFALSNAMTDGNVSDLFDAYNKKRLNGETWVSILGQISSVLNIVALVDAYKKQGYQLQDISDELKIHIFRIRKANEFLMDVSIEKVNSLIIQLADLERDVKMGKIDEEKGLDYFMLNLVR